MRILKIATLFSALTVCFILFQNFHPTDDSDKMRLAPRQPLEVPTRPHGTNPSWIQEKSVLWYMGYNRNTYLSKLSLNEESTDGKVSLFLLDEQGMSKMQFGKWTNLQCSYRLGDPDMLISLDQPLSLPNASLHVDFQPRAAQSEVKFSWSW